MLNPARADGVPVHATAVAGPAVLVEETPRGRLTICNALPCDVSLNTATAYRFVPPPGVPHLRESPPFVLEVNSPVGLEVQMRSQTRYVVGWVLIGVGLASITAGIVALVVGIGMNQSVPDSGNVIAYTGGLGGVLPGVLTLAFGAGEVARNFHSVVTATPSVVSPRAFVPPLIVLPF